MANLITGSMNRLPPRLRMFLTSVVIYGVVWLAATGLIETVQSGDPFILAKLAALLFGSALAALIRPIPAAYIEPAKILG